MKMDIMEFLPDRVREFVTHPTPNNRYQWQYTAALTLLRHGAARHEIKPVLQAYIGREEVWKGEMDTQIENAIATFTSSESHAGVAVPTFQPTESDVDKIGKWVSEGRNLAALEMLSPIFHANQIPTKEILERLFVTPEEPDPFLCAGLTVRRSAIHRLSEFSPTFLSSSSFVVASTMCGPGRRTDDNTLERRFYIVEIDAGVDKPLWSDLLNSGATPRDISAAVILHLHEDLGYPLTMAVNSAGKSVHGWFPAAGVPEENLFIQLATRLGADVRIAEPSQWWRMPNGIRRDKETETKHIARQSCVYLNIK
jgi:hypothetical protein